MTMVFRADEQGARDEMIGQRVDEALGRVPVVAILRGIRPNEVVAVADALIEAGVSVIEIPLNSPEPFDSIARLAKHASSRAVIGAGTVLDVAALDGVAEAGGQIAVTPNSNVAVIERALERGLVPMPGFQTATEAFAAYAAGARYLKLFPAGPAGIDHLKALQAVMPASARLLAVGGIGADNAREWLTAGVAGLGIGSDIYRPGDSAEAVHAKAKAIVAASQSIGV